MAEIDILKKALGLSTKKHPLRGARDTYRGNAAVKSSAVYLSEAVNIDITDDGAIQRRCGYESVISGLTNAHSLTGFADRYLIYADGVNLYSHDTVNETTSVLVSNLTPDAKLSYTEVDVALAYTDGSTRGLIVEDNGSILAADYPAQVDSLTTENREIVELPIAELIHYYRGSMYTANKGGGFLFCSDPYKINQYDQVGGYISVIGDISFITSTEKSLLIGTSKGLIAYTGSGVHDFREELVLRGNCKLCSEYSDFQFSDSNPAQIESGVMILCNNNVFFVSDSLQVANMTHDLDKGLGSIVDGTLAVSENTYILSGVTDD